MEQEKQEVPVLDKGKVALLDVMGSDLAVVEAARISYSSNKQKPVSDDRSLIRYLLRHKHTSVFEQVEFKFYIKCPIFVHNQLVRHRMANQNVLSGRYSEMPDEYYVPEENVVTKQNPNNKQGGTDELVLWDSFRSDYRSWPESFQNEQARLRISYEKYREAGMRNELARINLPLSQYTELYWKIDLHNLFHFLKLRLDSHAQYEIRVFAEAIAQLVKPVVPLSYEAFEDYILNAKSFAQKELDCLSVIFDIVRTSIPTDVREWENVSLTELIDRHAKNYFSNKREREEFIEKAQYLFLYDPQRGL